MIPSVLAWQMQQGVKDFLKTTFPISTPFFHGLIDRLLAEGGGVFKGPYISIQLPFRQGNSGTGFFPDLPLKFRPYLHQEEAFKRLSGPGPRSTIVATGTGSGKTECFLYPILDCCHRHRGERGIKAIIIYPMNALATDQAGRLAEIIHKNAQLRGHVTAGLFIGQSEKEPRMTMGADGIITNKETLRLNPPDILLTNYKMLDYLLIRPKDYPLWRLNGPETLRFLVVDELHTFDGAQGTDLACLLRRLKARVKTPPGFICYIGTSATLGTGDEKEALRLYAEKIFGGPFDRDAIINETRLKAGEFLEQSLISRLTLPQPEEVQSLNPESYGSYQEYIRAQYKLWFEEDLAEDGFKQERWRLNLVEHLNGHLLFQNLLKILRGQILSFDEVLTELEKVTPGLKDADQDYRRSLLNSLLALISEGRIYGAQGNEEDHQPELSENHDSLIPFLHVRVQLWLRELRRMVGEVSKNPSLRFADDLTDEQLKVHLPIVHCRECGSTGWAGLKRQADNIINSDLQAFYIGFFHDDPKVVFIFPEDGEILFQGLEGSTYRFCGHCLGLSSRLDQQSCPACGQRDLIRVFIPDTRVNRRGRMIGLHDCPYCEAPNNLTVLGSQAASLTSVLIGQLYSSSYNDDKKLLTFSDSVQDAAHRAGFFEARTYRFNFRSALQQFVQKKGAGLTLSQLPEAFIDYWSELKDECAYIAAFLPPDLAWFRDYEFMKTSGYLPEGSHLRQDVDSRIGWEIYSEYGFRARIGRTLEKSSSSVACIVQPQLEKSLDVLLEILQNEIGEIRDLDHKTLGGFLVGFLARLKNQGAVMHPVLNGYIESWGNTFLINRINWMPNFGRRTRAPAFLTTRGNTRFDLLLGAAPRSRTWYQAWAEKCFINKHALIGALTDRLYDQTLKVLVAEGILEERWHKGHKVWGIKPEAVGIELEVVQFRCYRCGHNASVASSEKRYLEGAPCLRFHCCGHYEEQPDETDYYGKLYATGDVERIFSEEHTGLLEREKREDLEIKFKAEGDNRKPWYPNLLSCTPTLELGIDIGDLSAVILCSVPPAQANYLQRIGRAGRRSGNSLNITLANGQPHDLYFFAEPKEMIAGKVATPGVFLDASAVLERQFTAFCFDRWAESGISEAVLPRRVGQVLGNLDSSDQRKFPHNFLRYLENQQMEIFDHFLRIFAGLTPESTAHLRAFVEGNREWEGGLRYRIMEGLHNLNRERESLRKKIRTLTERIRRKEKDIVRDKNWSDDLGKLKREKSALQALVKSINDRDIFNFFTDEGLIPNYAFPEAGVVLRSIVYRKKEKVQEGESSYENTVYEYERPAVSAISELAPESTFYAGGRKVQIDQVDMAVSEVEAWRFCNNCSYLELIGKGEENSVCPKCGSPLWADEGQKRQMLRMRQVFATTPDSKSRIGDDSDDREPGFYNKQMLVDFEDRNFTGAWLVESEELPFGFEFLTRATFREINFGEKGESGERVVIAGVELPRKGFTLCRYCGKLQSLHDDNNGSHALFCTARDQQAEKNQIDCVYLYREFSSEAIRMLLPVTTFAGSERKLHSFIAALQLGLRRKFAGNIEHLQTTMEEEPLPESSYRKNYLILYDTIPGGTGYLKQLMRSKEPIMEVFELALEALRSCTCHQDPNKDGCYRCLFVYRNSYDMKETSRDTAIELLSQILHHRERLIRIDNLKNVSVNALFDSELEARFIEALRRAHREDLPVSISKELVNSKPGYFLKIGEQAYYIEPQVKLGPKDGVSIPSQADFMLFPARAQKGVKPIAVFTDGYLYHRERIGLDMAQRMSIAHSGRYRVWSLTWKDVENRYRSQGDYFRNYLEPGKLSNGANLGKFMDGYGLLQLRTAHRENSFDWLIRILKDPDASLWQAYAFVHGLMHVDARRFASPGSWEEWSTKLKESLPDEMAEMMKELQGPALYGLFDSEEKGAEGGLRIFLASEQAAITLPPKIEGMRLACCLDDTTAQREKNDFESLWNGYVRLYNLFQFLPFSFFITRTGVERHVYEGVLIRETIVFDSEEKVENDPWSEIRELTGTDIQGLLDWLAWKKWPVPEVGYELMDDRGVIVATAELGWPSLKIAFLSEEEMLCQNAFKQAAWQVFQIEDLLADPESHLPLVDN